MQLYMINIKLVHDSLIFALVSVFPNYVAFYSQCYKFYGATTKFTISEGGN